MTKKKLRRMMALIYLSGLKQLGADGRDELYTLQAEFGAWEPEPERMALTRQELLEILFRVGRLQPWEKEELENLRLHRP